MASALMSNLQAFPGAAWLAPHTARRLAAAPHARWLAVQQGDVWLTTDGHGDVPGEDVWIAAGERWLLPADASVVLQGEPQAQLQVVEAAPRLISAASPGRAALAWQALRAWAQRHGLIAAPRPCAVC